jgi:hypothetical protein
MIASSTVAARFAGTHNDDIPVLLCGGILSRIVVGKLSRPSRRHAG